MFRKNSPVTKKQWEETVAFIREHRSNEGSFSVLYAKLEEVAGNADGDYKERLNELKEKQAVAYSTAKDNSGTAWPEFEKFVSGFERAVMEESDRQP